MTIEIPHPLPLAPGNRSLMSRQPRGRHSGSAGFKYKPEAHNHEKQRYTAPEILLDRKHLLRIGQAGTLPHGPPAPQGFPALPLSQPATPLVPPPSDNVVAFRTHRHTYPYLARLLIHGIGQHSVTPSAAIHQSQPSKSV